MNSPIRFLVFRATRPTHVYESAVYMTARLVLGAATLLVSLAASPAHARPWLLLSFLVSIAGALAAQTVRSGAARRAEKRAREKRPDVSLPCDPDIARAAAVLSACATLAPVVSLGQALAGGWTGALSGAAFAAALLAGAQSLADAAWSAWIYPAWRKTYTRDRDRARVIAAATNMSLRYHFESSGSEDARRAMQKLGDVIRGSARCSDGARVVVREENGGLVFRRGEEDAEDAPTTLFTRDQIDDSPTEEDAPTTLFTGKIDPKGYTYIRCSSLDDLLSRTDEPAPVGTRLYLNDDSPIVEYGGEEKGWFVDWHDGSTSLVDGLYGGEDRERFVAMAEGRES